MAALKALLWNGPRTQQACFWFCTLRTESRGGAVTSTHILIIVISISQRQGCAHICGWLIIVISISQRQGRAHICEWMDNKELHMWCDSDFEFWRTADLGESRRHHAKGNKSTTKGQTLPALIGLSEAYGRWREARDDSVWGWQRGNGYFNAFVVLIWKKSFGVRWWLIWMCFVSLSSIPKIPKMVNRITL